MRDRKHLIMDTALELFKEHGIPHTSIQMILETSQVAKGTFYKYFNSKSDVIVAILEQSHQDDMVIRRELEAGEYPSELALLADQLAVPMSLSEKRPILEMLWSEYHSGELEISALIGKQIKWLSSRLVDIYGAEIKPYSFDAAMLYFGMVRQVSLTWESLFRTSPDWHEVIPKLLRYIEAIIKVMLDSRENIFAMDPLLQLDQKGSEVHIEKGFVLELIDALKQKAAAGNTPVSSIELIDGLHGLIAQKVINCTLILIALKALKEAFERTGLELEARRLFFIAKIYLEQSQQRKEQTYEKK
ncbi:TetR/AcrR family transcriptional regulator [Paenibacillus macerans]|uniref:TetR/AcrR family transcriptional regulator n=1 Tax=Paenibacillus macerans TaxID=44252 RepID=UPI001F0E7EF8|nr:TetR/AcrR family transcriptional regulator [Paenibacillus macerans]MBS5910465.1 TetR/AcrR family transcriptional regulator [Paenibacillus macerans]MDU5946803.1 TetR/AcrR family transcriptional regulator [Paenibacillus macerans]MEC0138675.1 TetR/AcrR family transcriptional regulator [Paenibacillus macerans]UMV46127.1 TetR/AcrR family transcriptional regulator [Paenibacillus macerans]